MPCPVLTLAVEALVARSPEKPAESAAMRRALGEASVMHNQQGMLPTALPKLTRVQTRLADMDATVIDVQPKGAEISTSANGLELGQPSLPLFWARAEARGARVFVHLFGSTPDERTASRDPSDIIGQPPETTLAPARLIFSGLLDRPRALKIVAVPARPAARAAPRRHRLRAAGAAPSDRRGRRPAGGGRPRPRPVKQNSAMRYGRMDMNLIAALDVLLAQRSVTRAAAILNVSQSAASGILARLREYFDDDLLVQDGRRMRLTPLGESLLDPARQTMQRIDSLIATKSQFDPATAQRHFTIAASDYVISAMLDDVLQVIAEEAPGITFEFTPSGVPGSTGLESGEVDFAIVPAHMVSREHPHVVMFDDTYQVVAWQHNSLFAEPLAGSPARPFTLAHYQSLGHVIYRGGKVGMTWFEQWYANQHGDTRRIEVRAFSFSLLPQLVVGTQRIATLQTRLAQRYAQVLPLRLLDLPIACPKLTEVLQWNRFRDQDPGIAWLRARMLDVAEPVARAAS